MFKVLLLVLLGFSSSFAQSCFCVQENDQLKCTQIVVPTNTDCSPGDKRYVVLVKGLSRKIIQTQAYNNPIFYIKSTDLASDMTISSIEKIVRASCKTFPVNNTGDECTLPIVNGLNENISNGSQYVFFEKNSNSIKCSTEQNFVKAKIIDNNGVIIKTFNSISKNSQGQIVLDVNNINAGSYIVVFDDQINLGRVVLY